MEFNGAPASLGKILVFPNGFNSNATLSTNTWYNLVMVSTGSQILLYINGNLDISVNTNGPAFTANGIGIGADSQGGTPFAGKIAEARVYNKALTSAEVQQNFNALRGRFGI